MDFFAWFVCVAVFGMLVVVLIVTVLSVRDESCDERAQAEFDRRGQAALEALRDLGRKYPRPKNY